MQSDGELLSAWRAGDSRAGEALFERHFPAISRFFRNKVDDGRDDLIQSTFMACLEGRERFRGSSSFRTYLFGIAHNVLRAHLRTRRRAAAALDFDVVSLADLGAGPSTVLARRGEERLLLAALRRLPLNCQIVLELSYWEQLSSFEIAELLELPASTVRSRQQRARKLLERALEQLAESRPMLTSTRSDLEGWAGRLRAQLDP